MTTFLLELLSEEIPARMQAKARDDLARLFAAELAKSGLSAAEIETYATPRRLALIARGLPAETEATREETKGPRANAPPQALEGFLRKTGLTRDQLIDRDGTLFAVVEKPGRPTADVLADAIPAIVRAFPWPKSMRWGEASISTESPRWVRPLEGIVALLDDAVVPVEVAGLTSGRTTAGHRFHHPEPVTIDHPDAYAETLRAARVIVSPEERANVVHARATALAAGAGLTLVKDDGLVAENAGLTEWPVPLLGRFDPAFLEVPREVIQLTLRTNQKYFVCADGQGALAPAFVCVANIDASDGGAKIVEGNRRVLAARLSDARFFWEQDLKVPLEDQATKLSQIVFHEKLGTVADKVERVAKLARWLVEEGIVPSQQHNRAPAKAGAQGSSSTESAHPGLRPSPEHIEEADSPEPAYRAALADLAFDAARLAKADLVTAMVGEFPELQGIMGGHYARAQGEPAEVADAIRDHYKPVGQGDEVPTAPVTVAVSLADKLDTIVGFFIMDEEPSGSRDPFALRRSALGVISLATKNAPSFPLQRIAYGALAEILGQLIRKLEDASGGAVNETDRGRAFEKFFDFALKRFDPAMTDEELLPAATAHVEELKRLTQARSIANEQYPAATKKILDFFIDRLKVQQREAGVRHDLIDAVFAFGGEDDLVRLLARVRALQGFVGTEDGANLLAGYKRAANILKKEGWETPLPLAGGAGGGPEAATEPDAPNPVRFEHRRETSGSEREGFSTSLETNGQGVDEREGPPPTSPASGRGEKTLSYTPEPAEEALTAALDAAEPRARAAVEEERFEDAMTELATLRAPIDRFFDAVTVNDADPAKRAARLALLARVRAAVHRVADFSRIES